MGWAYGILEVGDISPTGDLTEILYYSADEYANVTYHFETTIHSRRQMQDKVIVDLKNRNNNTITTEEYDLVVGADGVRSRTRQLVMGSAEELNHFKPIGAFIAYFSIPKEDQD